MANKQGRTERKGWNWAPVPASVVLSKNLAPSDVRVYAYLLWRSGTKDVAWPKVETIAADLEMSEPTVKRAFKNLIKDNWIRRARRMGHSSITYIFESQEDCLQFDIDPEDVSPEIPYRIMGDTKDGSSNGRLKDSQEKKNQKKKSQEKGGQKTPPPPTNGKLDPAILSEMVLVLADATGMDAKINYGRLAKEAKDLILANYTAAQVRQVYERGGPWWKLDWRGKRGEVPGLGQIRTTIKGLLPKAAASEEADRQKYKDWENL